MAMCLNVLFDNAPGRSCKRLILHYQLQIPVFGEWKSGLSVEQLVLFPNKPSAIDCLPELLKRRLWGIPGLKWLSLPPVSLPVWMKRVFLMCTHIFLQLSISNKTRKGKRSSYTIKIESLTHWVIEVCSLHICVKCVDVERHRGAAGFGSPREAHERKQSTQCQLLADPS